MTLAAAPVSYAKMAAAPQGSLINTGGAEDSIVDQDNKTPSSPGMDFPPLPQITSPTSTESLLGGMGAGYLSTPMTDPHTGMILAVTEASANIPAPTDLPSMMEAFTHLLSKSLAQNAVHITSSIHADLQQLGQRIDTIEQKADQAASRINQNSARIQDLQDQLETAFSKIDDLDRSRR